MQANNGAKCADTIKKGIEDIELNMTESKDIVRIMTDFKVNKIGETKMDTQSFMNSVAGVFLGLIQYNKYDVK